MIDMKKKELPPSEELHRLFIYDPDTGILRNRISRGSRAIEGYEAGTFNNDGYRKVRIGLNIYYTHRIIWVMTHGDIDPSLTIDHIDGIRDNNRIENIRLVTHGTNMRNQKRSIVNTSGVVGVNYESDRGKWLARIEFRGNQIHLGRFTKKSDAIAARKAAEIKYGFHKNHGRVE